MFRKRKEAEPPDSKLVIAQLRKEKSELEKKLKEEKRRQLEELESLEKRVEKYRQTIGNHALLQAEGVLLNLSEDQLKILNLEPLLISRIKELKNENEKLYELIDKTRERFIALYFDTNEKVANLPSVLDDKNTRFLIYSSGGYQVYSSPRVKKMKEEDLIYIRKLVESRIGELDKNKVSYNLKGYEVSIIPHHIQGEENPFLYSVYLTPDKIKELRSGRKQTEKNKSSLEEAIGEIIKEIENSTSLKKD